MAYAAVGVGVVYLVGVVLLVRDLQWSWVPWYGAGVLALCVLGGVGVIVWKHRPRNDVQRFHDYLADHDDCQSVTVTKYAPTDYRLSPGDRIAHLSAAVINQECEFDGGSITTFRFGSRRSARAAVAADAQTQRSTYCLTKADVTTNHLGDDWWNFRRWCGELHGQYHQRASRS